MILIDKAKTKLTRERTDVGTIVSHREHWDGSVDGKVQLKAIRIRLRLTDGAPLNQAHLEAIGAFQEAQANYRIAKHSGQPEWERHARARLAETRRRLQETQ